MRSPALCLLALTAAAWLTPQPLSAAESPFDAFRNFMEYRVPRAMEKFQRTLEGKPPVRAKKPVAKSAPAKAPAAAKAPVEAKAPAKAPAEAKATTATDKPAESAPKDVPLPPEKTEAKAPAVADVPLPQTSPKRTEEPDLSAEDAEAAAEELDEPVPPDTPDPDIAGTVPATDAPSPAAEGAGALRNSPTPEAMGPGTKTVSPPAEPEPPPASGAAPESTDEEADPKTAELGMPDPADMPLPRRRPDPPVAGALAFAAPNTGSLRNLAPVTAPLTEASLPPAATEDGGGCSATLAALGVTSIPLGAIREGSCAISAPVAVSAFGDGTTKLTQKAIVNCAVARTAAAWLRDQVQPAATASLSGRVTSVRVAASYDCRNRNRQSAGKLSEHAAGNAIDLSAFQVGGKWIEVGGSHSEKETRFLADIRKSACGPFTTVLGPGSDAFHTDHFHLDLAKRGKSGRVLYCK